MNHQISHEDKQRGGSFYIEEDGNRIAELTYARPGASVIVIDHVGVDPSIEGRGVGRSLLNAAVKWARETATKIHPTCPFAVAMFKRDASIRDVLDSREA